MNSVELRTRTPEVGVGARCSPVGHVAFLHIRNSNSALMCTRRRSTQFAL